MVVGAADTETWEIAEAGIDAAGLSDREYPHGGGGQPSGTIPAAFPREWGL